MGQAPTSSAPMKNITLFRRKGIQSIPSSPAPALGLRATLPGRPSAAPLVLLCAALLAQPCAATPFQWEYTGSLKTARLRHTATLLSDGKVLVAGGGVPHGSLTSAELYDPATGTWSTTGSLNDGRGDHTATLLPNGMVLVAGGGRRGGVPLASAELYDPGIVAPTTVTGRGTLDNQGNPVTFNFHATQANDSGTLGRFSFCDPAAGVCATNAGIRSLSINGNSADFSGSARLDDGTRVTFSVSVTDNGLPGTSDTISISLSNGYSASGNLTSGDIQIY